MKFQFGACLFSDRCGSCQQKVIVELFSWSCHVLINNSALTLDGTCPASVLTSCCPQYPLKTRLIAHCQMRSRYPRLHQLWAGPYFDKALGAFHYHSRFASFCVHSISTMWRQDFPQSFANSPQWNDSSPSTVHRKNSPSYNLTSHQIIETLSFLLSLLFVYCECKNCIGNSWTS